MDEKLSNIKQNAKLASDFIRDHPEVNSIDKLHSFLKNNPGGVQEWLKGQSGLHANPQDLFSSFEEIERQERISNLHPEEPQTPQKNPFSGAAGLVGAPIAALLPPEEVKLAQVSLTEPSPDVNLYQFIPTEIANDQDFKNEFDKAKEEQIKALKENDTKKQYSDNEVEKLMAERRDELESKALERYSMSAERSDKIAKAREKDIYLKDANGNIIGEKIFKDEKGKPNPKADPLYMSYQRQKQAAIRAALKKKEEDEKKGVKPKYNNYQLRKIIEYQYDGHFAALFPEKANEYAKIDSSLKDSLKTLKKAEGKIGRKEEKQAKKEAKKAGQTKPDFISRAKKTAADYQREFNNNTLVKAAKKGYDRTKFASNLRKKTTAKTSSFIKKATTSIKPEAGGEGKVPPPTSTFGKLIRGKNTYTEWASPISLPSKAANRVGLNRRLGQQFGNGARKIASKTAGSAINRAGGQLAQEAVKEVASKALLFMVSGSGLVFLFVVVGIVAFIILISGNGSGSDFQNVGSPGAGQPPVNSNPIPGFTLTKSVSATQLSDAQQITYTISHTNTGKTPSESITVFDTIPSGTTLVQGSITGSYEIDSIQSIISWSLAKPENQALSSFSFSVLPQYTGGFLEISNYAWAESNSGGSTTSGSDCGGFYLLNNPKGNFGDPNCNFATNNAKAKSDLYDQLKTQDPGNADYWYLKIIPCESGYNPNAYLAASTSGLGAYGLFQMNPSGSANGAYDAGDVNWPQQAGNAINYNKQINGTFAYWACR